jgi:hypothetical protein
MMARLWMQRNWWQIGVLTIAAWTSCYIAFIAPFEYSRRISAQRNNGLAAVAGWDPNALWKQMSWRDMFFPRNQMLAHRYRYPRAYAMAMGVMETTGFDKADDDMDRAVVHTAALELEVKNPADCVEKIRELAQRMRGYLIASEAGDDRYAPGATITVRVPVSRFEETRSELKKLAVRIESEKIEAADVTKDYVDKEARLRNLRAQEAQYLSIMKHAVTVKDTLDVTTKLSEVRGQIEQQQAEFAVLAKQVETTAIAVTLHAQADAQVFGLHWRPVYALKLAVRDGVEGLANYLTTMTAAIFRLPAFLLWLTTIVVITSFTWRGTRWVWRTFFAIPAGGRP